VSDIPVDRAGGVTPESRVRVHARQGKDRRKHEVWSLKVIESGVKPQ
jgi:hypothetical protein